MTPGDIIVSKGARWDVFSRLPEWFVDGFVKKIREDHPNLTSKPELTVYSDPYLVRARNRIGFAGTMQINGTKLGNSIDTKAEYAYDCDFVNCDYMTYLEKYHDVVRPIEDAVIDLIQYLWGRVELSTLQGPYESST